MMSTVSKQILSLAFDTSASYCQFEFGSGGEPDFYIAPLIWQSPSTLMAVTQDHSLFADYIRVHDQVTILTIDSQGNSIKVSGQVKIVGKLAELPDFSLLREKLVFSCPVALLVCVTVHEESVDTSPAFRCLRLHT